MKSKSNLRQKNTKLLAETNDVYAAKKVSRKDLEDDSEDDQEQSVDSEGFSDDEDEGLFILTVRVAFTAKEIRYVSIL